MKKNNRTLPRTDSPFLQADERGRTHIEILGIDFAIDAGVPVTDTLLKILREAAEHNIQRPVLAAACEGKIRYSAASPEEIASVPPERRRKAVVSGIETELLAVSYDDTPIPALTPWHVIQAAEEIWLHSAYVAWATDEFPGPSDPDDLAILFPNNICKYHQKGPAPSTQREEGRLGKKAFPF